MTIEIIQKDGIIIAEIISDTILIHETQDALDLMAECSIAGADKIMLYEKNLIAGFFNLKSGIAGDILQKFSNYRVRLAIIGEFGKYSGRSFKAFVTESNRFGYINFVGSKAEAIRALIK
jgi:hypothetical protein